MRTELVTTLKRKATEIITELKKKCEPVLITQRGLPVAYLIDMEAHERMYKKLNLLEGIAKGEKAIQERRVVSHADAKQKMSRWQD